jgi:hypothetical protein
MKNHISFTAIIGLLIAATFPVQLKSQNMILAGQTEGEYIYYTDYEPDSTVFLFNSYDYFDLDIDFDGVCDLGFYVQFNEAPQWSYEFRAAIEIYNDNVEILLSTYSYAKNLSFGDSINSSMNWSESNVSPVLRGYQYSYIPPPGSGTYYGEFGSGYLGFRIVNTWETYYGWIDIEASVQSSSGSYIIAKSMAFYSQTVGLENLMEVSSHLKILPNPCRDKFTIQVPDMKGEVCRYHIFDLNGRKLSGGAITGQTSEIDASDFNPGVYFITVQNGSNTIQREKLIVQ